MIVDPARRGVSRIVGRSCHAVTLLQSCLHPLHPARPRVRPRRGPGEPLERPLEMVRAHPHRGAEPLQRHRFVEMLLQVPLGRSYTAHGVGLQLARPAAPAGAVPLRFGQGRRGEELHLPPVRPARRAGRPAIDPGRGHRVDEAAIGRGVAVLDRGPARIVRGGEVEQHGRDGSIPRAGAPSGSCGRNPAREPASRRRRSFGVGAGREPASARGRFTLVRQRIHPTQATPMSAPKRYDSIVIDADQAAGGPLRPPRDGAAGKGTGRADRPSPTTTSGSFVPTCYRVEVHASQTGCYPMRYSSIPRGGSGWASAEPWWNPHRRHPGRRRPRDRGRPGDGSPATFHDRKCAV